MAGKFEIYRDKAGEYRFRLKASNGQIVLASEGYKSKAGGVGGAESVQANCNDVGNFDSTTTSGGKFRFNRSYRIRGTAPPIIIPAHASRTPGSKYLPARDGREPVSCLIPDG